jgi:Family of unknown function (DUF6790)
MDTAYTWFLLGIIGALLISGIQFYLKRSLTTKKLCEIFLLSLLVITVGFGSIWAFIGHAFLPDQVAAYIGWSAGSPFQLEVAFANLAFGVLGILCFWIRGNFWTASIIGFSIFTLGAAYGHMINILSTGNNAPGNVGAVLILDILIPISLIALLVAYKVLEKRAMHSAIQSLERSL